MAFIPGLPGVYLRRAYYRLTLKFCAPDCHIGFGAIFAHRDARVERGVYIGAYTMLGKVNLHEGCLIGSRVSIVSGQHQHRFSSEGKWLPSNLDDFVTIHIGKNAWIGEAALIMADVGRGSAVAGGSVVSTPVPELVIVAGNPARFVRKLEVKQGNQESSDELGKTAALEDDDDVG
jgi:acetyltransferase-like isoleucine patch superfamily enzyme